ncbi:MAG: hypothetical protein IJB39_07715 [Alistipes sp.]|nr:hypothetical protein [Alistipes sp.]
MSIWRTYDKIAAVGDGCYVRCSCQIDFALLRLGDVRLLTTNRGSIRICCPK